MTTDIVTYSDSITGAPVTLSMATIKQLFCSEATDQEALLFLELCRHQGLNPFLRDAYLLKYGNSPATMVVGKDSFVKRAEAHPQYSGMRAGVIVERPDDTIEEKTGAFVLDEETLLGGWAEVHRRDRTISTKTSVSMKEYQQANKDGELVGNWRRMPATMVRKVAMVQALREAFTATFSGLYDASEMRVDLPDEDEIGQASQAQDQFEKPITVSGFELDPLLQMCPTHNRKWIQTEKMREAGHPPLSQGDRFCNQASVLRPILQQRLTDATAGTWNMRDLNSWLRQEFNGTWSQLNVKTQLQAIEQIKNLDPTPSVDVDEVTGEIEQPMFEEIVETVTDN
jgi:phage recombination protein Bet